MHPIFFVLMKSQYLSKDYKNHAYDQKAISSLFVATISDPFLPRKMQEPKE